jgi:hypothetical protein
MKAALAIAMIAFPLSFGHAATRIDADAAALAPGFAAAQDPAQSAESVWTGRWEGTTVSGQALILDIKVAGQRITGKLTVGKQSANITAGKALENAFAVTTGPIDGHSVTATGRQVGDAIELTIDGVKDPLTLTRAK